LSPYVTIFSFGSLLVPKEAFRIPFDKTIKRGEDTDWFLSLKERGFKFKQINKGVVLHYKDPVKRLLRSFDYAKDNAYIYIKHGQDERIIKSIIFQSATIFFSFITIITLIFYGIFYKVKKILFKKLR
jgi:GT2 family glycosyltransferase